MGDDRGSYWFRRIHCLLNNCQQGYNRLRRRGHPPLTESPERYDTMSSLININHSYIGCSPAVMRPRSLLPRPFHSIRLSLPQSPRCKIGFSQQYIGERWKHAASRDARCTCKVFAQSSTSKFDCTMYLPRTEAAKIKVEGNHYGSKDG